MAKTKKKVVRKQGLRPSQIAKAEKLKKKQEAKALQGASASTKSSLTEDKAVESTKSVKKSTSKSVAKKSKATKATRKKAEKSVKKQPTSTSTTSKSTTRTSVEVQPLKTITVKNAEGDPDTDAEILIQNKIDYTPKVSVVMPVYNVEPYLRQTLDSVLNQTLKEIELICVDDGSTDASLDILKEYAEKDNRITVITQKNLYAGVARNAGLSQARGEYLSFLDSDDFFEPTLFEETYKLAEKEQSQIVFYQYTNYDNETKQCYGEARGISARLTDKEYITLSTKAVKDKLFTLCNPMPWNKLINRKLAVEEDLHFQSLPASNDVCFSLNVLSCAKQITLYYKSLVYYRYNRRGSLKNTRDKNPLNFYEAYKGIYNTLQEKGLYDRYKKTFLTSLVSTSLWTLKNTDEKHEFVKQFIRDEIVPKYVSPNLNMLDSTILDKLKRVYHPDIIVSLTSYPARIGTIHLVIESILNQSFKADKVILWLAPEQFPNKEADLPKELLDLQEQGLTIDWYHDIRSYKKLIPTLKKYPEAIIVTADDDNIYQKDWLKKLFNNYVKYPTDIQAHRVTKFHYANNRFYTVSGGREYYKGANYLNKLVGVGGVLYPPHCFYKDILNEDLIQQLAPTNDDQWFWLQAALNGVKVRVVDDPDIKAHNVEGTQETGLTNINDHGENLFWKDFNRILEYYPDINQILKEEYNNFLNKYKDDSPYKEQVMEWYKKIHHKALNLNNPKTYNEKIQWLKLYDSTPVKTRLADKYLVRDWVKEKIGEEYLIPLLGVYDKFEEIDFDKLPNQFVIKCNHGCAYNIIVKDKSELDLKDAKEKIEQWMNEDFSRKPSLELHYSNINHKIIIERFIENKNAGDLYDYKFWCFNGKVQYIQFLSERNLGEHSLKMAFYDTNWNKQSFVYSYPLDTKTMDKPDNLDKMIELSEKLSKDFPHVRVDFYRLDDGTIYFGEMTFTSMSGGCVWNNEDINIKLGNLITLPKKAYNIDTGKYYKLHKTNKIMTFIMFPYYKYKIKELKKLKAIKINNLILSELSTFRLDIKNIGDVCNTLEITANNISISEPQWFINEQGIGKILQGNKLKNVIQLKAVNDGNLSISFRGQEKKYNGKRIPLWIDYKSIRINGKEILSEPVATWHDKPYRYEMPVKDGQEITLEVEQQYHEYTENELRGILLKLYSDNYYIDKNIDTVISGLKKRLPIIDEAEYKKQQFENCIKDAMTSLISYRLDIKNFGNENNSLAITSTDGSITVAKWNTNAQGVGKMLQGNALSNIIKIKAINDGKLMLSFRGQDKRFENKRFPLWVDYKSIKIDSKEILSAPIATWHDQPYRYEMPVKDGQEITLEIEQQYHQYFEDELKDVILKLNPHNSNIKDNIDDIIAQISERQIVYKMEQIKVLPQITANCFIPLSVVADIYCNKETEVRPLMWLEKYKLCTKFYPINSLMFFSMNTILDTIENGVSSYFNAYIEFENNRDTNYRCVADVGNKIVSIHDFLLDKSVDDYMPKFKEMCEQQYNQMMKLLSSANDVCFVCNNQLDIKKEFIPFLLRLKELYPNKSYTLINIRHGKNEKKITKCIIGKDIKIYDIENFDKNRENSNTSFEVGNEDLWNEVCSRFSLSESVKIKLEEEQQQKNKVDELISLLSAESNEEEKFHIAEQIFEAKNIKILSQQETIDEIKQKKISIARFGDGELQRMLNPDFSEKFQKGNIKQTERLKEVFCQKKDNILVCMDFHWKNGTQLSDYYKKVVHATKYDIANLCNFNSVFGNTGITRNAKNVPAMKEIWQNKDVVIVEGELSRVGIGNDLFDNVKSLQRILCPAENAFSKYDEILDECKKQSKDKLFLIALGPTATILAYNLANLGYWALDVGHMDICYEWSKLGKGKYIIPGKYVNEVKGGEIVEDCTDPNYLDSIIAKVV